MIAASHHLTQTSLAFDAFITAITQVSTQDYDSGESVIPNESVSESIPSAHADGARDDIATAQERGYRDQTLQAKEVAEQYAKITAMDDAFLAEMEAQLSTPVIHSVDTESHSHSHSPVATCNSINEEGGHVPPQGNMAASETALQANLPTSDVPSERATMAGATTLPTQETQKRGSRKKTLEDITPLPPPTMPSDAAPWNVDTCLKLAAYYRGYDKLTSERKTKLLKNAAISFIQRGKTREQAIKLFRYMKCLDRVEDEQGEAHGVFDEWWYGKEVDLWHVNEHADVKLREIERRRVATSLLERSKQLVSKVFVPPPTIEQLRAMPV